MPDKPKHTPLTPEQARIVMAQWKAAAPLLEKIREEDIRACDTQTSILVLDDAFESAMRDYQSKPTSGLVEMQRYFLKAMRAD